MQPQPTNNVSAQPKYLSLQVTWHRFLQNRPGVIALTVLILLSAAVIIIPFFSPFGAETTTVDQLNQPAGTINSLNGRVHILGTNSIGHDSFTRYLVGTRTSLFVSIISAVAIVILGSLIGAIAGFYGGAVDTLLMRLTDFMLSLPLIPVYLLSIKLIRTSAQDYVGTVATIALLFVLFNWMGVSRLVRGSILSLRTYSFVEASRALGANNRRLIFNHLLPNSFAPVLVAATFAAGDFIIWEAILSYFGQGITDPPAPSLGNLLTDAQGLDLVLHGSQPFPRNTRLPDTHTHIPDNDHRPLHQLHRRRPPRSPRPAPHTLITNYELIPMYIITQAQTQQFVMRNY